MAKNPFKQTTFRQPVVATELRLGGSSERLVGRDGHINASSKRDALMQIAKLMEAAASQDIMTEETASRREEVAKMVTARREAVQAAFKSKEAHAELGEVLADEIFQAANREGFMRRFLARQQLGQGQVPNVRMRMKNVSGVIASSPSKTATQIIRDNTFYPPEFYVTTRPFIEKREIDQSTGDVVQEKYIEGLEGIMVAEDRTLYTMTKNTVNIANPMTSVVGSLDPGTLSLIRNQVTRWDIPARALLIANDIWNDFIGNASFQSALDQVTKHELLLTGELGQIMGMTIYSDAFRHPQHKVLSQGDIIVYGDQVNLGQYTDRGGVESLPVDSAIEGIPGRGWMLQESLSMVLANARAVAYASRS